MKYLGMYWFTLRVNIRVAGIITLLGCHDSGESFSVIMVRIYNTVYQADCKKQYTKYVKISVRTE
jgi:hypothetical protein